MGIVRTAASSLGRSLRAIVIAGKALQDHSLGAWFGYGDTSSGVEVTEWTALNYSAVWCAVSFISGNMGSFPLDVLEHRSDGGSNLLRDHDLAPTLSLEMNPHMGAMIARETAMAHTLTWGNGYLEIERRGNGRAKALWPLLPSQVRPAMTKAGKLVYKTSPENGSPPIPAEDMVHIPGLGFDGYRGYSVVSMAREGIGLAAAQERYGASFFGQGAIPGGVLKHPGRLKEAARGNLRRSWNEIHQQPANGHRIAILEEGIDYKQIGIPPEDSQFLESRAFSILEMCRWWNLVPHILKDLSKSSYNTLEQQSLDVVIYTLRLWAVRVEQELERKLLMPAERGRLYVRHDLDALLRGDLKSRYDSYGQARQWGLMNSDEIRAKENMNPIPDGRGTVYLMPANMMPAPTPEEIAKAALTPPATTAAGPQPASGGNAEGAVEGAPAGGGVAGQPDGTGKGGPAAGDPAGQVLDVPDIRQSSDYDCGAAAVMAVCRFLAAGPESLPEYIEALGTSEEHGTAPAAIVDYLQSLGLAVEEKQDTTTVEDLAAWVTAGKPVICDINDHEDTPDQVDGDESGHYVVVIGVRAPTLTLQDPAAGRVTIDAEEFVRRWHDREPDGTEYVRWAVAVGKAESGARSAERITPLLRALAVDVVGRWVRKEAAAARRRATERNFLGWMDEFYPSLESDLDRNLRGMLVATLSGRIAGEGVIPRPHVEKQLRAIVTGYVSRSRAELLELSGSATRATFPAAVDQLVSRWELERPEQLAGEVLELLTAKKTRAEK